MTTCPTCAGEGHLDKTLHWQDCPPRCGRQHAWTCIVCMGSGKVSEDRIFLARVKGQKQQRHVSMSVFPAKAKS